MLSKKYSKYMMRKYNKTIKNITVEELKSS